MSENPRPRPFTRAQIPTVRNRARITNSATIIALVNDAVIRIPRKLITVFTTTNPTNHTHTGTAGRVAFIATPATRYNNPGTRM